MSHEEQLTPGALTTRQPQNLAAHSPRPANDKKPLQLKLSPDKIKAIKRDALDLNFPTVSDFMLACYEAFKVKK